MFTVHIDLLYYHNAEKSHLNDILTVIHNWQGDTIGEFKRLLKTHKFRDHGILWHF